MTVRPESDSAPANGFQCDVLIPCYNYGRYLADCVRSALRQGGGVRILIIDDASTDETSEIGPDLARRHPEVEYVRHRTNIGHIRTYNEGIDWATSPYFTLLSADDLMMPGALSRAARVMERRPDVLMAYGRELHFADGICTDEILDLRVQARPRCETEAVADGRPTGATLAELDQQGVDAPGILDTAAFYRLNKVSNRIPACAVVTRTDTQKRLGGYREELPHAGDLEMWLRFSAVGQVAAIPRFQVAHRLHPVNMTKSYAGEANIAQRVRVLDCVAAYEARLPRRLLEEMRAQLAVEAVKEAGVLLRMGDRAGEARLLETAQALDAGVSFGGRWAFHRLKGAVGPRGARALERIRHAFVAPDDAALGEAGTGTMDTIEIVFCANVAYFMPLAVAVVSLAESNRRHHLHIHVLTCDRDERAERRLAASLSGQSHVRLSFYRVAEEALERAISLGGAARAHPGVDEYVTRETYMRIIAADVLPATMRRAIYLDCDVVVVNDLGPLWAHDLSEATIGAAPDYPLIPHFASAEYRASLGMRRDATYINPGVLLIDLARWRARNATARLLDFVAREGRRLTFHDQDAINAVLHEEMAVLDLRWNLPVRMFRIGRRSYPAEHRASRAACRNPAILHYSGRRKPWHVRAHVPRKRDWFRHAAKTAWGIPAPTGASLAQRAEYWLDRWLALAGVDYVHLLYLSRRVPGKALEMARLVFSSFRGSPVGQPPDRPAR